MAGEERSDVRSFDQGDAMIIQESEGIPSRAISLREEENVVTLLAVEFSFAHGVVANFHPVKTAVGDHHVFSRLIGGRRWPGRNHHAVQILFEIESRRAHKLRVVRIGHGDGALVRAMLVERGSTHRGEIQIDQRGRSRRQDGEQFRRGRSMRSGAAPQASIEQQARGNSSRSKAGRDEKSFPVIPRVVHSHAYSLTRASWAPCSLAGSVTPALVSAVCFDRSEYNPQAAKMITSGSMGWRKRPSSWWVR